MIPFSLVVVRGRCIPTTLKSVSGHPKGWLFCHADHLRRMPGCPHVSRLEPVVGDQVCDVRLQGRGQLRVRSRHQPVADGRGQILHRPPAAKLPGCLQTGLGRHQLQGWRVHGEFHLHGGPFSGRRGQVTVLKRKLLNKTPLPSRVSRGFPL